MGDSDENVSILDVYKLIKQNNITISSQIDNINKDINNLSNKIDNKFQEINKKINDLEAENTYLRNRLQAVEKKIKKNNLIFYGVTETRGESESDLIHKIDEILKDKLQRRTTQTEITNIFRLGVKSDKNRPILVEFFSYLIKKDILLNRTKLKGTGIFIAEDLIEEDREKRRILLQHLKQARSNNKKANIRGNTLIIDGITYNLEELNNNKHLEEVDHFSPPGPRLTASEPATPSIDKDLYAEEQSEEEGEKETIESLQQQTGEKKKLVQQEKEKKRKLEETPNKITGAIPKKATNYRSSSRIRK